MRPLESSGQVDLRLPVLAGVAWLAALAGTLRPEAALPGAALGAVATLVVATTLVRLVVRPRPGGIPGGPSRPHPAWVTAGAIVLVLTAVLASAGLRSHQRASGVVVDAAQRASPVTVVATVAGDPRPVRRAGLGEATGATTVVVRVRVEEITVRVGTGTAAGERVRETGWRTAADAVVLGDGDWSGVRLGSRITFRALPTSADGDVAALLRPRGSPRVLAPPDVWWRAAEVVRAGVRTAVEPRPADQRALVPSLVVGDDSELDPRLADDFRTTGLTHLLAVSGTNLTLVLAFVLLLGRWAGVRGRFRLLLGALAIVGFVLVARGEPSVVRAATMGAVALWALAHDGRDRGIRTLAVAVLLLLGWQPAMSVSAGFALSVLATAGILLVAPLWRDALARWMPRWAAEAIAVPAAAQLACTPVVAGLSGEVSLVAVLANLLVAPAVAPATVLGLVGGLVAIVMPPVGQLVAWPGAWAVGWIVLVARWGAGLPVPAVAWGTSAWWLAALTFACLVAVRVAPAVLARPGRCVPLAVLALVVVLVPVPTPGWPPRGWVLVACDVGQGDALVLNAGGGGAVVVDAGPDPRSVDRCLRRLRVREVPLLVLTHFHADHVDGLPGVLRGRQVGAVEVSPVAEPAPAAAEVGRLLQAHGVSPHVSEHLVPRQVGEVTLTRLWPEVRAGSTAPVGGGDGANDSSVVLLATVGSTSVLLTGDVEPPAQRAMARLLGPVRVDVLKVPHHGSRHQSDDWLTSTGARVAVVSAGRDNTHGHPAPELVALLEGAGMVLLRTDTDSDVAVVERDGQLGTAMSSVGYGRLGAPWLRVPAHGRSSVASPW
ncbi:ComEC/Rec2 family competence protein [Nocardioides sp. Y6]|uniref:ComEC/Rec2 family competence protein n=1 Tax=Nocardioides malaquae TaxID=2773426 RepID=A0ABR9RQL4_9ACTN|nr:ComEC/Rec2 family competence protein [Nocardioides malaquae]MBE7323675.1 ComEC/Rec2 family competence protein [Nocardioides malaquae]